MSDISKHKQLIHRLLSERKFVVFNMLLWIVFAVVHAIIVSMSLGEFSGQLKNISASACAGFLYCYGLRAFVTRNCWFKSHLLGHVPVMCLFAVLFSAVDTGIHYWDLIVRLPITCAPETQPPESYLCGVVSNAFFERIYMILIWLLLYTYFQYERYNQNSVTLSHWQIVLAIFMLVVFKCAESMASGIAWVRSIDGLSFVYFFVHLALTIILARVILLVQPREKYMGSQFIPILPTFVMLIFCLGIIEILVGNIVFRTIQYAMTAYHSYQPNILLYVLLGGSDGIWRSAGDLSGPLYSACRDLCVISVVMMHGRLVKQKSTQASYESSGVDIKRAFLFWIYNLNGWFVVAVCLYFSDLLGMAVIEPSMPGAFALSLFISGVFLAGMIRSALRNYTLNNSAFFPFAVRVVGVSLMLGVMQSCVIMYCNYIYIYLFLSKDDPSRYAYFISYTHHFLYVSVLCGIAFVLWSLVYEISIGQREKVDAKLRELLLENNIKQLQLNTLAGKIDPHFIFNALNNIRYLVRADAERSREALLVLSDILRSPIAKSSSDKVLLLEELDLVRHYILLSKIQFEERLQYEEEIAADVTRLLIPPMMLQILVENAIKHGISQLPDGGVLRLILRMDNDNLICRVINTGELLPQTATDGFGMGTKNVQERLRLLYGASAQFQLSQMGSQVVAELIFPLEYS